MKFLLLALLSCICSADDRRLRSIKQWARKIDISKTDNITRIPLLNKHVDLKTDVVRLRHYDDHTSVRLSHFRDDTELPHPIRHRRRQFRSMELNGWNHHVSWPVKREAVVEGDLVLGGLMMVHEREDTVTCGPVMPQGGVQALEAMLYTLDILNQREIVPGVKIGAHILDDCDKDTYGLEMAVDFIKGMYTLIYENLMASSSLLRIHYSCMKKKQVNNDL